MSGFLKIRDFFKKSVLRKMAEFSVSDTGDPLILTCLRRVLHPGTPREGGLVALMGEKWLGTTFSILLSFTSTFLRPLTAVI